MTELKESKPPFWQPALVIFSQVTGLIAGPIIVALYLGKWLDIKYQSEPWLFLLCMAVAFAVSSAGIVIITLKYIKKIEKEAKENKTDNNESSNGTTE